MICAYPTGTIGSVSVCWPSSGTTLLAMAKALWKISLVSSMLKVALVGRLARLASVNLGV